MQWDDTVDVVVVGSGLAGLSAALAATADGLRALVLEKGEQAGGGTTYSFGGLWIGNNAIAREQGFQDSRDETIAYLRFLGAGYEIEENLLAFVDGAPAAYVCRGFVCDRPVTAPDELTAALLRRA